MSKTSKSFIFILVLTAICLYLNLPFAINQKFNIFNKEFSINIPKPSLKFSYQKYTVDRSLDFKQGLDIRGGVQITLDADMSNISPDQKNSALESVRSVINRRVDGYGVSEASVRTVVGGGQYRLLVELPGLDDPKEAVELIGQTASLIFATPVYKDSTISGQPELVDFQPSDLTGNDLESASLTFESENRQPSVSLKFKSDGTEKFSKLTQAYLNKPLAIYLDGSPLTMPTVNSVISNGQAIISGSFTVDQAKLMATQLNAGALPVPVKIVTQKNIAATLGADSIRQSLIAGAVGLIVVVFYMILQYQLLGFISVIGLVVYALISATLYRLIPVTLTLPGLAGFILSVGMAVDSNILIFERFKEEKRANKPTSIALELAFGRAWDSIKDANMATIITGLVLFNPLNWSFLNSSGPVKGFAFTLLLGIAISLFTGVIVTRTLLRLFIRPKKLSIIKTDR